ncbi:cytochrome P450 [Actinokineospora spheciospongiae]|uniref:cytochrome P450 n=1 Tax=Actinokineospora spheciospongiae TaxID=909613 RepID=UPI000D70F3A9|nr:cytochrome P450 [Actinokineospora spheciospongiae]PWW66625.1 cytochrome P450 [Actinokineospora spheciospongiae]
MSAIPVFAGPPLLGLNLRFLRDPIGMFSQARRDHGDVVQLDLGLAGPLHAVFHPEGVKRVLMNGRRTHRQLLRELLGKGLFTSPSGDDWGRRRRLLTPLFRAERLAAMTPLLLGPLDEALDTRWRTGERIDLATEMKRITVAMMVEATFGTGADVDRTAARAALDFLLGYVDHQLFTFATAPRSWPTPANRRYRTDIAALRRIIGDALVARTRRPGTEPTFLDGLLEHRAGFSDEELVDEVLSIFIAGTETTGTALVWALHLLSLNGEVAEQLRAEVDDVVGQRDPTGDLLRKLRVPRAAVREALRLYPPAWALRRVLDEPLDVGGHVLPAGARTIVSSYVTHRHPDVWSTPDAFLPERWLSGEERHRFAYFPFGAGAHQCVGNTFAQLEGDLVLTRVAQRFRLDPLPNQPTGTKPAIALTPVPAPTPLLMPV